MNKLYIIGGAPRCGKTIILNEVIKRQPMIGISSDAIRAGVRYLNRNKRIDFSEDMVEDVLPWEMLVGLIQRYDHQNIPLVAEGVVFTPERVKSLQLKNLELKVAFVGFESEEFIDHVIERGKRVKDYVYDNIIQNNGDEAPIRETFKELYRKSVALRTEAEREGYAFFSIDTHDFEVFKNEVVHNLLG